jgi:hypothetical protein
MKREAMAKVMAIFALIWISVWVLWTWLLAIFWDKYTDSGASTDTGMTKEQIQKMIDEWKVKVSSESWAQEKLPDSKLLEDITSSWTLSETWSSSVTWTTETKSSTGEIKK